MSGRCRRVLSCLIIAAHLSACATGGEPLPVASGERCDRPGGPATLDGAKVGVAAGVAAFKATLAASSCSDLAGCGFIALFLPIMVVGGAMTGLVAGAARGDAPASFGTLPSACSSFAPVPAPPPSE